jgi:hypothetical protein
VSKSVTVLRKKSAVDSAISTGRVDVSAVNVKAVL